MAELRPGAPGSGLARFGLGVGLLGSGVGLGLLLGFALEGRSPPAAPPAAPAISPAALETPAAEAPPETTPVATLSPISVVEQTVSLPVPPGGNGISEEPGEEPPPMPSLPAPTPPVAVVAQPEPSLPAFAAVAPPSPPPPSPLSPSPLSPSPLSPPGRPAWQRHAVHFVAPPHATLVVVVFDDLGMDRRRTQRVVALPGPLTLAFLPYAGDLAHQTRAARAAGHELLVHLPMEPVSPRAYPGPGALLTTLPADELQRRLVAGIGAFDGHVGVNNHMGSRFTATRGALAPVLAELQRRGLMFLDSRTTPDSVAPALAAELHLPFAGRDVFLDDDPTPAAVAAQLRHLEQVARRSGLGIAIGHPHDATIEAVAAWLPGLAARGLTLAPVTAAVRLRGGTESTSASHPPDPRISVRKGDPHG